MRHRFPKSPKSIKIKFKSISNPSNIFIKTRKTNGDPKYNEVTPPTNHQNLLKSYQSPIVIMKIMKTKKNKRGPKMQ